MSMKDFIDTLNEEQKKALLEALTAKEIDASVHPEAQEMEAEDNITEDFRVVKSDTKFTKRREPVRARENSWTDTGESRDIKTPKVQKTPRTRKAPSKKEVRCHICGRSQKVNANIIYGEFYRCDRCIG